MIANLSCAMFLSPRISTKALAELCQRLAVETEAGIDVRRSWQREAENARGATRDAMVQIRDDIARGESISLALARTGGLFPRLFLEMVHVGEQTGTLGRVYQRLAEHYKHQQERKRMFRMAIAWPMLQLAAAIAIIGIVIWMLGAVAQRGGGRSLDILGFGLVGSRGLVIYINFVTIVGLVIAGLVVAIRRGVLWTRPLQRAVMRLPVIGTCLEKLAIAQVAWALHLMLNVEMDIRRVMPLALRATGNDYYTRHADQVVADLEAGMAIHEALDATGAFPATFIDALAVAEESGELVTSMGRLSRIYQQEAESALSTLTKVAGFGVWLLVAALIIFMIFRLAFFYIGTINDALNM